MAKKINVAVAAIGVAIMAVFVLGGVFVYMHYNKNPDKLLQHICISDVLPCIIIHVALSVM